MKSFSTVPVLLLSLLAFLPGLSMADSSTPPKDLTEACDVLVRMLAKKIPAGKTVAVRRFSAAGGAPTLLGIRIQDLLTNALSALNGRKFQVVERLRMAELDLERMTHGAGNGDDLDQWAQALKVDLVILGTYGETEGRLNMDCRLLAPETGLSPGAAHVRLTSTQDIRRLARTPTPANPAAGVFEAIVAPGGSGKKGGRFLQLFRFHNGTPVASEEAPAFRLGEHVGFSVRPPMDCRLYIFNYDPQGDDASVVFVYPLPQIPARIFHQSRSYFFPECVDPKAVSYPVEAPLGRMVFKVIGVAADAAHGDLIKGLDGTSGYYQLHPKDLKTLIGRLAILPRSAWWEESVDFWVME